MQSFFEKYQITDPVIAAGVSGGADSLALVWQLNQWAVPLGRRIVALTVNHGLRPEAVTEAEYTAKLMQSWGVEHHTLVWEGPKPKSGIEAEARAARYQLMADWCRAHQVRVLAVGHHLQDQAETFLLRLKRGSGLYGLSGMLPLSYSYGICIIRPQLEQTPAELRQILKGQKIDWCEDASNQNEEFERVKMRKFLPEFEAKIGISCKRLAQTAGVLARTRHLLEEMTEKFLQKAVRRWEGGLCSVELAQLEEQHPEMAYRILAVLIKEVGQKMYIPEAEEMLRLCDDIGTETFKGCTLGHCEIFTSRGKLWIIPELKDKKVMPKKNWAEFVETHAEYARTDLPYKVRQVLYSRLAK